MLDGQEIAGTRSSKHRYGNESVRDRLFVAPKQFFSTGVVHPNGISLPKDLKMDFQTLLKSNAAALIITAKAKDKDYDFVSRFFAPAMGINEDPVTGSAHCSLAPYWTEKLGKAHLVGLQLSQRTGIVRCKWLDDRVFLMGKAKTFLTGKIDV